MGRKINEELLKRGYFRIQVFLTGETLDKFLHEKKDRVIDSTVLGAEIIRDHYRNKTPIGYKPKDQKR